MSTSNSKFIVLDRDGVINEDLWGYVTKKEDFNPIPGSINAIKQLNDSGYRVFVATNQACINKRIINQEGLDDVHDYMCSLVKEEGGKIDYIAFCPHSPEEKCSCRKPETGLLVEIEQKFNCTLRNSFFIGDKESDVVCAIKHGCIPLLVETGYGQKTLASANCPPKELCFQDLEAAVKFILNN